MTFDLRVAGRSVAVALPLVGPHFVTSFLAAAAAADVLGIPLEAMAEAATSLRPASHRGEVRRLGERVVLLDDCYNSSPAALEAALVTLSLLPGDRRVAVLGDMLELGPTGPALHRERGRALAGCVDALVGVGPLAREIVEGAREAGMPQGSLHHFATAAQTALALPRLVRPGDAVLVKASRGVRLEAVVDALAARFGEGEA
jgi:UDP-N-acetylmuramoyl-tripeptide--D-alanyl-D-alanine ligase